MSANFSTRLVNDSVFDISDKVSVDVFQGGLNITPVVIPVQSLNNTSQRFVYNPTEDLVISTQAYWRTTQTINVSGTVPPNGWLMNFGVDSGLAPFPALQMLGIPQIKINTGSYSVDLQNCLDILLKEHDSRELSGYDSLCPYLPDSKFFKYADAAAANAVVIGSDAGLFSSQFAPNGLDNDLVSRGAWKIDSITNPDGTAIGVNGNAGPATITWAITFTCTVPLIGVSPFTYALGDDKRGMRGVKNLELTLPFVSPDRVIRTGSSNTAFSCSYGLCTKSELILMTYLPPETLKFPPACVLPYHNIDVVLKNVNIEVGTLIAPKSGSITSDIISLNSIPEYVAIAVRKQRSQKKASDADAYYPINSVSINLSTATGLLNTASTQQLYQFSKEMSSQNWTDFLGVASKAAGGVNQDPATLANSVQTNGGVVYLQYGKHIQLREVLAPGTITNLNLQLTVNYNNYGAAEANAELVIMNVYGGVISIANGQSSPAVGLLSELDVVNSKQVGSTSRNFVFSDSVAKEEGEGRKKAKRHTKMSVKKVGMAEGKHHLVHPHHVKAGEGRKVGLMSR